MGRCSCSEAVGRLAASEDRQAAGLVQVAERRQAGSYGRHELSALLW